ncbi:MFS transporter [Aeromicrobium sp. CTD01-1L150]|uniref:MFS transporter n=1 Tax=Aeromicrobium sp. CTD01-1L150 TaxID=3341830 RepID=UPI0035BFCCFC
MSIRARFLLLLGLRWLSTGLVIPVVLLLPLSRGLSVTEVAVALAAQGVVVLLMEIPSGGLTDAWGRRRVFLLANAFVLIAYSLTYLAQSVTAFAVAFAVMGLYRALDSGALEAWFVDAEHAAGQEQQVPSGLAASGGVIAAAIAVGSLSSAALLHLAPWPAAVTLAAPYVAAAAVTALVMVCASLLMHESTLAHAEGRLSWTGAMRGGLGLVMGPAVRWFVVAIMCAAVGVAALELLMPVRLQEFSAEETAAAAAMGVISAGAWALASMGAFVVARILRHRGPGPVAVVLPLVQMVGLLTMAVAMGPTVLVAGFWTAYLVHTAFGAVFNALVHERVDSRRRATALSITSMAFLSTAALANIGLGKLADGASTPAGLLVGAVGFAGAAGVLMLAVRRAPVRPPGSDSRRVRV